MHAFIVVTMTLLCLSTAVGDLQKGPRVVVGRAWLLSDASPTATAASEAIAPAKAYFITIGDSITAFGSTTGGWVSRMASAYGTSVNIINKGMAMGWSLSGLEAAQRLTQEVFPGEAARRVKLVTLCFGANDANIKGSDPTWRAVQVHDYAVTLTHTIGLLKQANVPNILLITPPAPGVRADRSVNVTAEYAAAVIGVANKMGLPYVDLFTAMVGTPNFASELLAADGLHLSEKGNVLLYNAVMHAIDKYLPQISPAAMLSRA